MWPRGLRRPKAGLPRALQFAFRVPDSRIEGLALAGEGRLRLEGERLPQVQLLEVKGEVPSQRPWVRYEYTDPALQQLSAGQRLLLRLGPAHQARVLDWLRALRPLL